MQLVGPALGDGIDQRASEIPLTNVERGEKHLVFLDGFQGDLLRARLPTGLAARAKSEEVVGDRAVDLDSVEAIVLASARVTWPLRRDLRRQRHEISEIAIQRWEARDRRVGDRGGHALVRARDDRACGSNNLHAGELGGLGYQHQVDAGVLSKRDIHVTAVARREADAAGSDRIRASNLEALDVESPIAA